MRALDIVVPSLVALCGPAGSGKSTWAASRFLPTQIVSSDQCRALVGDDPADQRVSRQAFELFHRILGLRADLGRLSVADSTALSQRARADLLRVARAHGLPSLLVLFALPLETCLERNDGRDRAVPEHAIREQHAELAAARQVIPGEGWDRLVVFEGPRDADSCGVRLTRGDR
jgi:protein phosphatase